MELRSLRNPPCKMGIPPPCKRGRRGYIPYNLDPLLIIQILEYQRKRPIRSI